MTRDMNPTLFDNHVQGAPDAVGTLQPFSSIPTIQKMIQPINVIIKTVRIGPFILIHTKSCFAFRIQGTSEETTKPAVPYDHLFTASWTVWAFNF